MATPTLDSIIIDPQESATHAVIWLHGLGDSGNGFAPVVPELSLPQGHGIRFVFPHAPEQAVTINQGYVMRSWYDIKSMDLHNRADINGVLSSEKLVLALIEEQIAQGIPAEKIVLAGFSQGGVMSLFTGLRYTKKLAGIIALSCYLPSPASLPEACSAENKATPILQNHGVADDVVPLQAGESANQLLTQAGYNVDWATYQMGHSVVLPQLQAIGQWLAKKLS